MMDAVKSQMVLKLGGKFSNCWSGSAKEGFY